MCYCRPCTSSPCCYVLCEWQINICMVGNLRKEERAAVSVLCLGRREIRGAVIGCVERSHTDKSQQRKVLYCCLKTGSERWKIIWSFAFRVFVCVPLKDHLFCWLPFQNVHVFGYLIMHANTSTNQFYFCLFFHFYSYSRQGMMRGSRGNKVRKYCRLDSNR